MKNKQLIGYYSCISKYNNEIAPKNGKMPQNVSKMENVNSAKIVLSIFLYKKVPKMSQKTGVVSKISVFEDFLYKFRGVSARSGPKNYVVAKMC